MTALSLTRNGRVVASLDLGRVGRLLAATLLTCLALGEVGFLLHLWAAPAVISRQPDDLPRREAVSLPMPPAAPAFVLDAWDAGPGESAATVAAALCVSEGCIRALNPEPAETLRVPPALQETVVFRARGGESLPDLAAYWAARYPAVDLAAIVAANALDPRLALSAGQEVLVPTLGLDPPMREVAVKTKRGWNYTRADWPSPVPGAHLSKRYGGRGVHLGIDFAAPFGSAIHCVRDGRVEFAGNPEGAPAEILAAHPNLKPELGDQIHVVLRYEADGVTPDLEIVYGHLYKKFVVDGGRVGRNQVIALMGNNGLSSGPHVHVEVWADGEPQNPLRYMAGGRP